MKDEGEVSLSFDGLFVVGGWGQYTRGERGEFTGTALSSAPAFFLRDETLKPGKGTAGLALESQLEIEDGTTGAEDGLGGGGCFAVDVEDGHDQGVADVAMEEPCFFVHAAACGLLVERAESKLISISKSV